MLPKKIRERQLKLEISESFREQLMRYAKALLEMEGVKGEVKGIEVIATVEDGESRVVAE